MQNTKHTPGKWIGKFGSNEIVTKTMFTTETDKEPFMTVIHTESEWSQSEANARLIAAAPELLEALEALRLVVMQSDDRKIWDNGKNAETVAMAYAAIQKAKGGQK